MPATTIGIYTKEEWEEFYSKLCKKTDWSAGSFAPALCSYKNGPMIDYILVDSAPVEGGGYKMSARDEVHYCEYKWYDATEAPYCY
ncbi:MAG: hypothetical protein IJX90_03680 [Blautia sp.]|nr:hypothetical protein [Blautia sp.]